VGVQIFRANEGQVEQAYAIVQEYYAAACVVVREDRTEFAEHYFGAGAGVWLASEEGIVVGCVALRRIADMASCGEVKRLYVKTAKRGLGIADLLLEALEEYARESGYEWLYLDTAAEMKAAARFYLRKGFTECERYNGNPQAALFLRKALG
jgi:GNAT superfamily N-acetyltransferase